ncbi:hypothetical protein LPJ61_004528 [Coemansia biformis]|uniref:Tyrosinase copper-binding domain-containing protein n=1 Tax=Coemansia biformis TaxID=1286918 RepID=A0A9W8CWN9_9FUNG|nr:hypothetical protein LPJ61_004528 [Coemansia biformis]
MKLSAGVLAAAAAIGLSAVGVTDAQQTQPRCSSVYTRKELLSLTPTEWNTVSGVLRTMQNQGWFAWFAYLHTNWFSQIHSQSQFFPFHRRFVYEWERVARQYNPAYVQPYWDEMRDYRAPATSAVLSSNWVGSNGQGTNRCVMNGVQGGWTMSYLGNHCLQRNFARSGNLGPWYSPEYITSIIQRAPNMTVFRPQIEFSLHGIVHIETGGDMATRASVNDWIFMLHHTNIDRLWWQWQQNGHLWTMDGPNWDGTQISLNTNIAYFNEPIRNVMQLGYGQMCYQYATNPLSRRSLIGGVENLISSVLPPDVLHKWFPDSAKVPSITFAPGAKPPPPSNGKVIPYPREIPDSWIVSMGNDLANAKNARADARNFVEAMNKAGYKSPY